MTRMVTTLICCLVLLGAFGRPAAAEVVDAAAGGFTVAHEVEVSASPEVVYRALTDEVARWWNPSHTFSGDAANLRIEARPGGCFCEDLPGGGVQHLEVVYAKPGEQLRLRGGLGPLQGLAVSGTLTFQLTAGEETTTVALTYAVAGYLPDGLAGWAGPVSGVLEQQLDRLERYVETGSPEAPEPEP